MDVYLSQPCERCGSKKRVEKTWKETQQTFSGTTIVEYSQIVCTNKVCQATLDKNLLEEARKRKALKLTKEANDLARKANSLFQAKKARTKKSRI